MVLPVEDFAVRFIIWLIVYQSKGLMHLKFVHPFVDTSQ